MNSISRTGRLGLALAACALLAAGNVHADGLTKGATLLSVTLRNSDVSYVSPLAGGYISAYPQTEWGAEAQYQRMLSDQWAIALAGGIGTYNEKDTPTSVSGNPDVEYKQSSWNARIGADRFIHIGTNVELYMGPGVEYWSGTAKVVATTTVERARTKRISLDGRMGGYVGLGGSVGLTGQISRYTGYAKASDQGADAKWWPSGTSGQIGLAFKY